MPSSLALARFYFLTFAVTWIAWLAPTWLAVEENWLFALGGPVFLAGVFAPGLVALALTAHEHGSDGVVHLLEGVGKWQVGVRWYLFAVAYMAALKLLAASIQRVVTGAWPPFGDAPILLMLGATLLSTWTQAGEELGWRAYALPPLAQRLGLGGASVLLGVIWAVWHLPLFFLEGSGSDGQSFPIYLLHVTTVSVAMAWLYWRTGRSLLLVMLMHGAVNNTIGIVPARLPYAVSPWSFDGTMMGWTTVALASAVAVWLVWRMRDATIVGRRPACSGA